MPQVWVDPAGHQGNTLGYGNNCSLAQKIPLGLETPPQNTAHALLVSLHHMWGVTLDWTVRDCVTLINVREISTPGILTLICETGQIPEKMAFKGLKKIRTLAVGICGGDSNKEMQNELWVAGLPQRKPTAAATPIGCSGNSSGATASLGALDWTALYCQRIQQPLLSKTLWEILINPLVPHPKPLAVA